MKSLVCVTLCGLIGLFAATPVESSPAQKHEKHQRARANVPNAGMAVHVWFSPGEVQVIREYYAPKYRRLPPGLQKKLRRTGQLPPGWQKKFEPFPVVLERQLVVMPSGYRRGVIEGHAVVFNPRTQVIVDVAVLF